MKNKWMKIHTLIGCLALVLCALAPQPPRNDLHGRR